MKNEEQNSKEPQNSLNIADVSGSFKSTIQKEFENLWNGKARKEVYVDERNCDNDRNVKLAFEIMWG